VLSFFGMACSGSLLWMMWHGLLSHHSDCCKLQMLTI
jgi:hypothetical protein